MDRAVQVHAYAQNTDALFDATAGYGWGCSSIALFCRVGGGSSTEAAAVCADLSALNEYRLAEGGMCIPACIAHIVGDTVGVVAGMEVVFFGSFAEATCAVLVLYTFSGVLGILRILGKQRGFPCSSSDILTLVLRTMISRVRDAHGVVEKALKLLSPFAMDLRLLWSWCCRGFAPMPCCQAAQYVPGGF